MINLEVKSKLNPEEVVKRAVNFFGPKGYGLEVKEQSESCAYFEGGGGGIEVTACIKENETSVELQSREWDFQVKEFINKIR
jgi:hypothetical protein